MRKQIFKMAEAIESILNSHGEIAKRNSIRQILLDFKNSTENEIKVKLANDNLNPIKILSKTAMVYSLLTFYLDTNCQDSNKLKDAYQEILKVYEFYELKYLAESEHKSDIQNQDYIETILVPLMVVIMYFEHLYKSLK